MVALVTGSTGFVGQNLLPYLKDRGIETIVLTRSELSKGIFEKINSSNAVIHLAGKAHDLNNSSESDEYDKINYRLTKDLYDAFLKSSSEIFIFISSVKAVADHLDKPLTEDCIPSPKTDYGKSKLMAEEYIQSQALPSGKIYYIFRPCMIHGPGNKGNLNLLYKVIAKGIPYPLAAFNNERSFLSVENLCFIILEFLKTKNIPSGIYHTADDDSISTNKLIEIISNTLGISPRLLNINPKLVRYVARASDFFGLPLNTDRLNKLTENYVVDTTKLKNVLRRSLPVNTIDGIVTTIKSFRT